MSEPKIIKPEDVRVGDTIRVTDNPVEGVVSMADSDLFTVNSRVTFAREVGDRTIELLDRPELKRTPGQVAYEAFPFAPHGAPPVPDWFRYDRAEAWEKAAAAVLAEFAPELNGRAAYEKWCKKFHIVPSSEWDADREQRWQQIVAAAKEPRA